MCDCAEELARRQALTSMQITAASRALSHGAGPSSPSCPIVHFFSKLLFGNSPATEQVPSPQITAAPSTSSVRSTRSAEHTHLARTIAPSRDDRKATGRSSSDFHNPRCYDEDPSGASRSNYKLDRSKLRKYGSGATSEGFPGPGGGRGGRGGDGGRARSALVAFAAASLLALMCVAMACHTCDGEAGFQSYWQRIRSYWASTMQAMRNYDWADAMLRLRNRYCDLMRSIGVIGSPVAEEKPVEKPCPRKVVKPCP